MPTRRIQALLPLMLSVLLLGLIVYRGVTFYFQWRSEPEPVTVADVNVAVAAQPDTSAQNFAALAQLHLFGTPAVEKKQPAKQEIPETRAQLKLHGVFVDGEQSGAIIGEQNGRQQFVPVNGALPNGIKLKAVYADHVVLERNGTDEALRFPKVRALLGSPQRDEDAGDLQPDRADPSAGVPESSGAAPANGELPSLHVFPVMKSGAFVGYRILPGRERALYQRLQLQPGDIVTAVNGQPVVAGTEPAHLAQQLSMDQDLTLTVQRGDQVMALRAER